MHAPPIGRNKRATEQKGDLIQANGRDSRGLYSKLRYSLESSGRWGWVWVLALGFNLWCSGAREIL